jgi:hypothetical protein
MLFTPGARHRWAAAAEVERHRPFGEKELHFSERTVALRSANSRPPPMKDPPGSQNRSSVRIIGREPEARGVNDTPDHPPQTP